MSCGSRSTPPWFNFGTFQGEHLRLAALPGVPDGFWAANPGPKKLTRCQHCFPRASSAQPPVIFINFFYSWGRFLLFSRGSWVGFLVTLGEFWLPGGSHTPAPPSPLAQRRRNTGGKGERCLPGPRCPQDPSAGVRQMRIFPGASSAGWFVHSIGDNSSSNFPLSAAQERADPSLERPGSPSFVASISLFLKPYLIPYRLARDRPQPCAFTLLP